MAKARPDPDLRYFSNAKALASARQPSRRSSYLKFQDYPVALACRAEAPTARRLVGEVGLEPTKAKPADLQSAPFAARDTPPHAVSGELGEPPNTPRQAGIPAGRFYGEGSGECQPEKAPWLRVVAGSPANCLAFEAVTQASVVDLKFLRFCRAFTGARSAKVAAGFAFDRAPAL